MSPARHRLPARAPRPGPWASAPARPCALAASLLALAAAPERAHAQRAPRAPSATAPQRAGGPPVRFTVTPRPGSYRWSFALTNTTAEPVRLALDGRLLWLEATPPPLPAGATAAERRAFAAQRPLRCTPPAPAASTEALGRVTLPPEGSRAVGFDLRALCGFRALERLAPGWLLTVHYGLRGAPTGPRAVVFDGQLPHVTDLVADAQRWPEDMPPAQPPQTGGLERADEAPRPAARPADRAVDEGAAQVLSLRVRGTFDAANAAGIRLAYTLRNEALYPARVFHRPGVVRLEVRDPRGATFECYAGARVYSMIEDFVQRLAPGRSVGGTLSLVALCDASLLRAPGVYQAAAVYAVDGTTLRARSSVFYFRLRAGDPREPYAPLPAADVFAPTPRSPGRDARAATP